MKAFLSCRLFASITIIRRMGLIVWPHYSFCLFEIWIYNSSNWSKIHTVYHGKMLPENLARCEGTILKIFYFSHKSKGKIWRNTQSRNWNRFAAMRFDLIIIFICIQTHWLNDFQIEIPWIVFGLAHKVQMHINMPRKCLISVQYNASLYPEWVCGKGKDAYNLLSVSKFYGFQFALTDELRSHFRKFSW